MIIQGVPDLGPGIRLHLNENTGGCSPKVVEAVRAFDAERLALYPDFREAIVELGASLGVEPERIVLTNGLDEGILLASIAYLGNRTPTALVELGAPLTAPSGAAEIVVAQPAFDPYLHAAQAMGARIVAVPPGPDYAFPVEGVLRALTPSTRVVYVNNPNNPSGRPVAKADIHRVAREAGQALVFVDEAYHDFLGENFLAEAADYPNVLIGRTFSKAYGLAGMRVGIVIGQPQALEPVRAVTLPFNINGVARAAIGAALADTAFLPRYAAQVHESRQRLYAACTRLGLEFWESAANVVMVRVGETAPFIQALAARKVHVRDRSKDPTTPGCIRITAGVVEHTDAAIEALESVLATRQSR